jgi:hypothetical protein
MGRQVIIQTVVQRVRIVWQGSLVGKCGLGLGLTLAALGFCYGLGILLGWGLGKLINL